MDERKPNVSKPINLENKLLSTQSFKEFYNKIECSKPQKSNLTEEQMRQHFVAALNDVGAKYKSLTLELTTDPEFIEVFIDNNRNLVLKYSSDALKTVPEEGITALLLHEACHVSTLPNSMLSIPMVGGKKAMAFHRDNMTNYDEYLAHVEFIGKFRNAPRFKALLVQQYSLTNNFDLIHKCFTVIMEKMKESGQQLTEDTEWYAREQVNNIVYDSLFFYVSGDSTLSKWFADHSLGGFWEYGKWLYEDFEFIRKLGLSIEESHDKAIISGTLAMSVNPYLLLLGGKIVFAPSTKQLHEELIAQRKDVDLVQLWEARRNACEKGSEN